MEQWVQAASSLGFPIVAAIFLMLENKRTTDKFIELSKQAALDSQASTEAIKQSTEVIQKNTEAFTRLTAVMERR